MVDLTATVTDGVALSATTQARFTTDPNGDIVPPAIYLATPTSGTVTRAAEQRFRGDLSEPATFTIDGAAVTLDANDHFDYGPVTLAEGANSFDLVAIDAAGNVGARTVAVTLDSTAPPPVDESLVTVGSSSGGQVTVTGTAGAVSPVESGELVRVENDFASGFVEVPPAADGSFTVLASAEGGDELAIATRDTAGNRSAPRLETVPGAPALPPDPAGVAPALDPTVATGPCELFGFFYQGSDPIQAGVAAGAIDCQHAGLIHGRVLDRIGQPVAGVRVSVFGGPNLGSTLTRSDGAFDFVLPGGSAVGLQLRKAGYLPVQRRATVSEGALATLPDVALTAIDAAVTTVDATGGAPSVQVARGSAVSDADGTRRATLLFPAGTTATLLYRGGATEPAGSLAIRETEYTVGPDGPAAMPAELPPASAYTYAVEISADEALAAGASGIALDRPVVSYTENFLDLPVGLVIPVGSYDRELGHWVAEGNGRVLEILSVTSGLADLDVDGTGTPADATRLAELGVTDSERGQLAAVYTVGQSLWRVPLAHFSTYDYNLPVFPPAGATPPERPKPKGADQDRKDRDCRSAGSVIECTNQVLGEDVAVTGTPYALHYRSDRVPSRTSARTLEISLTGSSPPASLQRIDLTVDVAGQHLTQSFTPAADLSHTFTWDGLDAFGRTVQGGTEAQVSVGYVYDADYARPPDDEIDAFARAGTAELTGTASRQQVTSWQRHEVTIGGWNALTQVELGGWTLTPHHGYDPSTRTLYYGDGEHRAVHDVTVITGAAGTGQEGFGGDGGPAEDAVFDRPRRITLSRDSAGVLDGGYFIADNENCRIRRVLPDGTITTFAGSGCRYNEDRTDFAPASGDGGPATEAVLSGFQGQIVQAPDGTVYFTDVDYGLVRRVTPDGTIDTVIGYDHYHGAKPGPTPGTSTFLSLPIGLAMDSLGDLWLAFQPGFGAVLPLLASRFRVGGRSRLRHQ